MSINLFNTNTLQSIIKEKGLNTWDVISIGIYTLETIGKHTKNPLQKAQKILQTGISTLSAQKHSVSFSYAIKETLIAKRHRRKRTLNDILYISNVFIRKTPNLERRRIHSITTKECAKMINNCFNTPRQRYKARLILHGIFAIAKKRGWCKENPVHAVDTPILKEKTIHALILPEVKKLINTAKVTAKGACLAPLSIMLYAGIRPQEVHRLKWNDINLQQNFISISASHSKTGGSRHVHIERVLKKILIQIKPKNLNTQVCPPNWNKKWKEVRQAAGWNTQRPWIQDCLRHSYASFHALYYKDFSRLQYEMGHSSSSLLRTRYLNMQGLTLSMAKSFWGAA